MKVVSSILPLQKEGGLRNAGKINQYGGNVNMVSNANNQPLSTEKDYIDLVDWIVCQDNRLVNKILQKNVDLDVTYERGEFFTLAINNNNAQTIKTLLNYFEDNQLSKYESSSYEYLVLKHKMTETLKYVTENEELSSEMKKILSPYIDFEGSNCDMNDFLDDHLGGGHEVEIDTLHMRKKSHSTGDIKNYSTKSDYNGYLSTDERSPKKEIEYIKQKEEKEIYFDKSEYYDDIIKDTENFNEQEIIKLKSDLLGNTITIINND